MLVVGSAMTAVIWQLIPSTVPPVAPTAVLASCVAAGMGRLSGPGGRGGRRMEGAQCVQRDVTYGLGRTSRPGRTHGTTRARGPGYASGRDDYLARLRKAEGQVRGLQKMVEAGS